MMGTPSNKVRGVRELRIATRNVKASTNDHSKVNRPDRISVSDAFTVHDVETCREGTLTVGFDPKSMAARATIPGRMDISGRNAP